MHHHRPRPVARTRGAARRTRGSTAPAPQQAAVERRRCHARDHRAARGDPLAARELDADGAAARDDDPHDLRADAQLAPGRGERADERTGQPPGTAARERDAVAHVGERLEEGEHRAARDVGPEVEVHAPGGDQRVRLARREVTLGELARRADEQPAIASPTARARARGGSRRGPARERGARQPRAVEREERRRESLVQRVERLPARPVARVVRRAARRSSLRDRQHAQRRAVGEDVRERPRAGRVLEPVALELAAELRRDRRAAEQVHVRREGVVDEARERQLVAAHGPAGALASRSSTSDAPARARQVDGRDEAVVTGADDDRVVARPHPPALREAARKRGPDGPDLTFDI